VQSSACSIGDFSVLKAFFHHSSLSMEPIAHFLNNTFKTAFESEDREVKLAALKAFY